VKTFYNNYYGLDYNDKYVLWNLYKPINIKLLIYLTIININFITDFRVIYGLKFLNLLSGTPVKINKFLYEKKTVVLCTSMFDNQLHFFNIFLNSYMKAFYTAFVINSWVFLYYENKVCLNIYYLNKLFINNRGFKEKDFLQVCFMFTKFYDKGLVTFILNT